MPAPIQAKESLVMMVPALAMVLESGRAAMHITEIEGAPEHLAVGSLHPASKPARLLAMFADGAVDSTMGGSKILRLPVLLRLVYLNVIRTNPPPARPRLSPEPG